MAFISYNERLKRQQARRDVALQRLKLDVQGLAHCATDKLEEARNAITHQIDVARSVVAGKISETHTAVTEKLTETRQKLGETAASVKHALNPAVHIRRNPWAWMAGIVALGFFSAPLVKKMFSGKSNGAHRAPAPAPAKPKGFDFAAFQPLLNMAAPLLAAYVSKMASRIRDDGQVERTRSATLARHGAAPPGES